MKNLNPYHSVFISKLFATKWTVAFIVVGLALAMSFFYVGINVSFEFRLRGDAWSYMEIAHQFTSFSEAFHYVGDRSLGFPLFDYLFLYLDANVSVLSRVNHICLTLFIIHELTSFWVCFVCLKSRFLDNKAIYFGLLFMLIAAYPAIVMHTTTPLSDVFGMDLLLVGFSLFAWGVNKGAINLRSLLGVIFLGFISGAFLAYAILVRPAYWPGVVGFIAVYMLMTAVNRLLLPQLNAWRAVIISMMSIVGLIVIIAPVVEQCKAHYHTLCLQDPDTFNGLESMKVGLTSARTVWSYTSSQAGVVPFYPDSFLVNHFGNRCPITSAIGEISNDNTNLLSCMYHAPHWAVIYFIKKVTGLFDTFRMTPYTESITPIWYVWVARSFSSIAFLGFWILLWTGVKRGFQCVVYRKPVSAFMAAASCFCIIQVFVHSILHVEERYALPWIPFCIIAFLLKVKEIRGGDYSTQARWMWLLFAILVVLGYFIQVSIWDYGMRTS